MVLAAGSSSVRAQEEESEALDTRFFRGVMRGLGLRKDGEGIEYRERSPLVLPPSRDLPPPQTAATDKKPASWPKDPDIEREREKKAIAAKIRSNPNPEEIRPLTQSQMAPAGGATGTTSRASQPSTANNRTNDPVNPMSPAELGSKGIFSALRGNSEEYSTFAGEPVRTTLTEPPAGYRTPSPAQPYGVGRQRWTPTAANVNDRSVPVR